MKRIRTVLWRYLPTARSPRSKNLQRSNTSTSIANRIPPPCFQKAFFRSSCRFQWHASYLKAYTARWNKVWKKRWEWQVSGTRGFWPPEVVHLAMRWRFLIPFDVRCAVHEVHQCSHPKWTFCFFMFNLNLFSPEFSIKVDSFRMNWQKTFLIWGIVSSWEL